MYFLTAAPTSRGEPLDWTQILTVAITAVFGFAGGIVIQRGKKAEIQAQNQQRLEEKVARQDARIDALEKRLNEETRMRRIEERFSHLMTLDIDVTVRFLDYLKEYLVEYAEALPGDDSPTVAQVQAVIDRLQAAIGRRHGAEDETSHVI